MWFAGSAQQWEQVRGAELIVVDEAAQATETSTLIPLRHLASNLARCVLVGDPRQLPATVLSLPATAAGFDRSLFARLQVKTARPPAAAARAGVRQFQPPRVAPNAQLPPWCLLHRLGCIIAS